MHRAKSKSWSWKILYIGCGLAILLFSLRLVLFKPYEIPSGSMEPTLYPGDCIVVNKLAYLWKTPVRGDLVVFKYPEDQQRTFIKRVIALPGERCEIINNQVYINGVPLAEPYIKERKFSAYAPVLVPQGKLLVMGDNRNNSRDSRHWGVLPMENLLGKAMLIYSPVYRQGILY